jgi:outer membrane protein insertion porin family
LSNGLKLMRSGMQSAKGCFTANVFPIVFISIAIALLFSGCSSVGSGDSQNGGLAEPNKPSSDVSSQSQTGNVRFVGNRAFKDKVLRQRIGPVAGDYLDPVLIEMGRKTIINVYRKIGFAFVDVKVNGEEFIKGNVVYEIDEGPRVKIASVKFSGNESIKAGSLKKVVKTRKRKWFYWPFYYSEETVADDVGSLENLYYNRGFLDYDISVEEEFSDDKNKAYIVFMIDEGPVYRIEDIFITGNRTFDVQKLREKMQLQPGQVYLKRKADLDAKNLAKFYHEYGFIDTEVMQWARFIPDVNMVNVEVGITEGNQFRIGRIDIVTGGELSQDRDLGQISIGGNEFIQDKTVRRILDEYDFTPGELYNADIAPKQGSGKLEDYVQRKMLAEQVIIRPEGQPYEFLDDPNLLGQDVIVGIEEGKTGLFQPGVGLSSDSGIVGSLVFDQRNFDINDWPKSFGDFITMNAFRGAGQRMRISASPGTEVSVYSVEFGDPYWRDKPVELDLVGSKYERFRESYNEGRLRGFVGFEQRRKENWRRNLTFRAENVAVFGLDYDAPKEIIDVKGDNVIFGVKIGTGRDMTDDEYRPSRGYTFNIDYEQVTGDQTFGVPGGTYVWYKTLYEDLLERKTVLATKLHAATVLGDAPPFEKFYAGGSYSMRGFEYRGVSTRGLQTNVPNPMRKDPIGSDWIFLASSEVTVPLVGNNIAALFFVDSGAIDTGAYRAAAGLGIQILIPWFGEVPMRFELATPFMKNDDDDTQVFSFSIGGRLF